MVGLATTSIPADNRAQANRGAAEMDRQESTITDPVKWSA